MVFETQLDGFSLLVQNERGFLQFLFRTVAITRSCACSACLFLVLLCFSDLIEREQSKQAMIPRG